ncbi:MAG: tRNA (guanine(10)-N(2))-dimethyltransferase [Candidatus Thorarchaeota archaeon]|nr:MAG: tRNA (guanine(10)-N(2))-dimethyltransferase [Candidatus Thorarchaeota archaeon]
MGQRRTRRIYTDLGMPIGLLARQRVCWPAPMIATKEYTEGTTTFLSADIEHYAADSHQLTSDLPVFYNPRMRVNRDLSVLFLLAYLDRSPIQAMCEPLAGCGVRTLRYLNECPGEFHALVSDTNPLALDVVRKNIERYGFEHRTTIKRGDAKVLLLTESREKRFDFVDLDPFGSPAPFLTAAVQSLSPKRAMLGLTATDMPVLCGAQPRVAIRKYGGLSIRAPFSHELAVRLLIGRAYSVAAMNDCAVYPLAALSTDHYIRVWLDIRTSCTDSNDQARNMGFVVYCEGCMRTETVPLGPSLTQLRIQHERDDCKGRVSLAGPLWTGEMYNQSLLDTASQFLSKKPDNYDKRVPKLLGAMREENALADHIYVDIHALCDLHGLESPSMASLMTRLREAGYKASRTHFRPTAIRTNASVREITASARDLTNPM